MIPAAATTMTRTVLMQAEAMGLRVNPLQFCCPQPTPMEAPGDVVRHFMADATQVGSPEAASTFSVWWLVILTVALIGVSVVVLVIEKVRRRRHSATVDAYIGRRGGRGEGIQ